MKEKEKREIIAEFGEKRGKEIIEEKEQIEDFCVARGIKNHSTNADGNCNMGCC